MFWQIFQAAFSDILWRCLVGLYTIVGRDRPRPLNVRVDSQKSQVKHWNHGLEADIAVQFESVPSSTTIRRFRGCLVTRRLGILTSQTELPEPAVIDVKKTTKVNMDRGLTITHGISPLYYLRFRVKPFRRAEQNLRIAVEALNQTNQVIEITPNWQTIVHNELPQNSISRVRDCASAEILYEKPRNLVLWVAALAAVVLVASPIYFYFSKGFDYIEGSVRAVDWGATPPDLAHVTVDAKEFVRLANEYKLMLIARPKDNTVDAKEDLLIDKSSLFEITTSPKKLQLKMSNEVMTRIPRGGVLQLWVLIVPKSIKLDEIRKINDAVKMGAKVVANPSLIVYPGLKTEPSQQPTIENPERKAQAIKIGIKDPQIYSIDLKSPGTFTALYAQRDRPDSSLQLDFNIEKVVNDTITVAVRGTIFDRGKLWDRFGPLRYEMPLTRKTFTFHFTGKTTDGREIPFPAVRWAILNRDENNLIIATGLASM